MRKAIGIGLILLVAGATAQAVMMDDFESYADQAAFEASWPKLFKDNGPTLATSMNLVQGASAGSGNQCVSGVTGANNNMRNYKYVDDFNVYKGTDAAPMIFEAKFFDLSDPSGTGARNAIEIRGYDGDGFANAPPYLAGVTPVFGGTGLRLIALGAYNSPATVPGVNWYYRIIGGGVNGWFETNAVRQPNTWTTLTAKVYASKIEIYVNGVLDSTKALTSAIAPMDAIILGSGLTSSNVDVGIDDVLLTPEPAALALLGVGCLFLRRRRTA